MFKRKKTWVLIADGARARIFIKGHQSLDNATGVDYVSDHSKTSDLTTDSPGRVFESGNSARHAYSPRMDWHQHQKQLFAKKMCEELHKTRHEFDELILISPPKTLGEIRSHLCKDTLQKVTLEIPKDITKLSEHELIHYMEREL